MKDNAPKELSMHEELSSLDAGLCRRELQIDVLQGKLDATVKELGLDLSRIKLPRNRGAILKKEPEEAAMEEPETPKPVSKSDELMPATIPSDDEDFTASPPPPFSHQLIRDPAVVELLNQAAGMAKRHEHMRVSVENLDRKLDALAEELHQWRREDDLHAASKDAQSGRFMGMSPEELKRLVGMGLIFLMIAVLWHFCVG